MAAVTVLDDFKFSQGRLFKLCFPDVPPVAREGGSRYQWVLILDGTRHDLKFVQHTSTIKTLVTSMMEINVDVEQLWLQISIGSTNVRYDLTDQLKSTNTI